MARSSIGSLAGKPTHWESRVLGRAQMGDRAAQGELIDQFLPMVYGLALTITGDRRGAESVATTAFLTVTTRTSYRGRSIQHPGDLRAHVALTTRNAALAWRRAHTAGNDRHPGAGAHRRHHHGVCPDPIESTQAERVRIHLTNELNHLTVAERSLIEETFLSTSTIRQIAAERGVAVDAVADEVSHAVQHLWQLGGMLRAADVDA
ncbi:hypothetical protein GCM10009765_22480 [Fodinicola feengrottensis]|uniref:Sigma-70 family RNA polymerase sigma factor n=2 Tax=Fodinicola feengrottensis TaxID=435914 RepID=A0ABN2GKI2_9ACTN